MIGRLDDFPGDQIGGKAAGLLRLRALGLPIPPAMVVPVAARGELWPGDEERVRELGWPLAIRSSAVGEDAKDRSAAGQYLSVMGVEPAGVAEAVRRVYRSATSERVRAYRTWGDGRTDARDPEMAVIVQREVRSSRAGVVFSRDPLTGTKDVVVECVFGHGVRLVSGGATPDRFRVDADGRVGARLAVRDGADRLLRTLRDDEVSAVAAVALRAEEGFGYAVDAEFCFEGSRLWLVQCRAITALGEG